MELISIGKFAKIVGVTPTTLTGINYKKKGLHELINKISNQEISKNEKTY